MAGRVTWMDILKNEVEKSPFASNLFFSMILTLLEKLVELDFACPCDSKYNAIFGSAFFVLPGILSLALMMCLRGCKRVLPCCIPLIVWLTLIFLDGQYFACAMTDWSGSYETVPQTSHLKWCKPDNTSHKTSEELLRMTRHWFSLSQGIGMGFILVVLCISIFIGICFMIQKRSNQNNNPERYGHNGDNQLQRLG